MSSHGKTIFCLDEMWDDTHNVVLAKQFLEMPSSRGNRITFLNCGCETMFIEECLLLSEKNLVNSYLDYRQDMTSDLLEDWFENTLVH